MAVQLAQTLRQHRRHTRQLRRRRRARRRGRRSRRRLLRRGVGRGARHDGRRRRRQRAGHEEHGEVAGHVEREGPGDAGERLVGRGAHDRGQQLRQHLPLRHHLRLGLHAGVQLPLWGGRRTGR